MIFTGKQPETNWFPAPNDYDAQLVAQLLLQQTPVQRLDSQSTQDFSRIILIRNRRLRSMIEQLTSSSPFDQVIFDCCAKNIQ